MKITVEFDIEIDGDCSDERAKVLFTDSLLSRMSDAITSEDINDTDDFAIFVRSWEVK